MVEVPDRVRRQPTFWGGGADVWLDALPDLVASHCRSWGLDVDGQVRHGSHALVVPVRRAGTPLALRLVSPQDDLSREVDALQFWAGRGTVLVVDADISGGALLLERLDAGRSAAALPLDDAVPVLAAVMRRLAVRVPTDRTDVPSTADGVATEVVDLESRWRAAGPPTSSRQLGAALDAGDLLSTSPTPWQAVNGDLHYEQLLAGTREAWLAIDPVLLRGDPEYDLARILWSRLDEMTDSDVLRHAATVVEVAGLASERARCWLVWRSMSYLLWGLAQGLTEDPARCRRILDLVVADPASGRGRA